MKSQWAKSPNKQSVGAELTKTHSFRLFFGDLVHWENVHV